MFWFIVVVVVVAAAAAVVFSFSPVARNLGSEPVQRLTHLLLSHYFLRQHLNFPWRMSIQALTRMEPI